MSIFLDTGVLVAFHNASDERHGSAKSILWRAFHGQFGRIFSSEYVVDEGTTLVNARSKNRSLSDSFLSYCLSSASQGLVGLLGLNSDDFAATASEYLKQSELSFTDCSSLVLMRKHGIRHIATFDKAFGKVKGVSVVSD